MLLGTLLPELIIKIASADPEVWYHLYRYYPEFTQFAKHDGRAEYIRVFTQTIIKGGAAKTYLFGKLNSIYDQPSAIYADGMQIWYRNDHIHRIGGPALVDANGQQEWWLNGNRIK